MRSIRLALVVLAFGACKPSPAAEDAGHAADAGASTTSSLRAASSSNAGSSSSSVTCEPAVRPQCAAGTPGGQCGDTVTLGECADGGWRCPSDMFPAEQCACIGRPPGNCTCGDGGWACVDAGAPALRGLSVAELATMLAAKDFLMIDVHVPYEGDIPGTDTSISYTNTTALEACIGTDLQRKVVLTCMSGSMSSTAGNALVTAGYANVSHLVGGMNAWVSGGHALEHVDGGLPACP